MSARARYHQVAELVDVTGLGADEYVVRRTRLSELDGAGSSGRGSSLGIQMARPSTEGPDNLMDELDEEAQSG
jgi:hypothetical protein